jgi:hypothetical protein
MRPFLDTKKVSTDGRFWVSTEGLMSQPNHGFKFVSRSQAEPE